MLLKALVSSEKFNDIIKAIKPTDLISVQREYCVLAEEYVIDVTVETSIDKMLAVAKETNATRAKPPDLLPGIARLYIRAHSKIGEYCWDNEIGNISFWVSNYPSVS